MSDTVASGAAAAASPSNTSPIMDRIKTGATVLGAIAGALTGLWGVYEKVRAEARHDTAASYNTLAPQVNQLGEALKQLQLENQQLRGIVAEHQKTPRLAQVPRRAEKTAAAPAPNAVPAPPTAAPATTPGAQPATPAQATAPEVPPATDDDPVSGLLHTVGRTRAAIEDLRKVPDDFGRVLQSQRR